MKEKDKKEYGDYVHNQVIGWTENGDTKASILLAFIGIFVSIFFTSDYILNTIQNLMSAIVSYWKVGVGQFDILSLLTFTSLGATLLFIGWAVILLFDALSGKTKCNEDSIIFFGKIQGSSFEEYIEKVDSISENDLQKDKLQQIYNCSKRCAEKFSSYNKAIKKSKWGLLFICIFMTCLIAVNGR